MTSAVTFNQRILQKIAAADTTPRGHIPVEIAADSEKIAQKWREYGYVIIGFMDRDGIMCRVGSQYLVRQMVDPDTRFGQALASISLRQQQQELPPDSQAQAIIAFHEARFEDSPWMQYVSSRQNGGDSV